MTRKKINEINDWISNASDNDVANLLEFIQNENRGSKYGLNAFEFEYFNKITKIFNRFRDKIPDINKAEKIIHLIEIELQNKELNKKIKNRKYAMNCALYNLYPSSEKINIKEINNNFKIMCKFLELFYYECGSYLRPIMLEFFPQEYEAAAFDVLGDKDEAVNMYHTDVFPFYFKTNKIKVKYLQKLWLASYLHLSVLGDKSIVKIIKSIDSAAPQLLISQ